MKQYWFSTAPGIGYGVTAYSIDDAKKLLAEFGYPHQGQRILNVKEGVQLDDLDQNHVIPNCGLLVVRGIWYPLHNI